RIADIVVVVAIARFFDIDAFIWPKLEGSVFGVRVMIGYTLSAKVEGFSLDNARNRNGSTAEWLSDTGRFAGSAANAFVAVVSVSLTTYIARAVYGTIRFGYAAATVARFGFGRIIGAAIFSVGYSVVVIVQLRVRATV